MLSRCWGSWLITTENLTVAAIQSSSGNDRSVAGTLEESNDCIIL